MEREHTQNEGDSGHSVNEKGVKNIPVYTPEGWYIIVRAAQRKNPLYKLIKMSEGNMFAQP